MQSLNELADFRKALAEHRLVRGRRCARVQGCSAPLSAATATFRRLPPVLTHPASLSPLPNFRRWCTFGRRGASPVPS